MVRGTRRERSFISKFPEAPIPHSSLNSLMYRFRQTASVDGRQETRPSAGLGNWVLVALLLIALLKIALVSNHGIVAWYRPHDDYWQIISAAHWIWWRPYSE